LTFNVAAEKFFPVPDSLFQAGQMEFYLGRTDSVCVDKTATFTELQGTGNTAFSSRLIPNTPFNTMKLTDINIPPYPNLPINLSVNMKQILNTGIDNNNFSTTRVKAKTINNRGLDAGPSPNANNILPFNQPRSYTQADIGELDRRLTNVEYEVALTAMEANVQAQAIPSSVNPATNRFKFGFFVDNFSTSGYSDINNPQYEAQKDFATGDIIPLKMVWDVSVFGIGPPDWIDFPVVQQPIATVGSVTDPLGLGPVCAINLSNTVAYSMLFRNGTDTVSGNTDIVNLTFAANATLTETIQVINEPLDQYLAENPGVNAGLAPGAGNIVGVFGPGNPYLVGWSIQALIALAAGELGGVSPPVAINGVRFPNLQAAIAGLNLNAVPNIPAGGVFVADVYQPPVSLYFYNFDQPTKIEIYQNGNLIATTDTGAVGPATPLNLTASEIALTTGASAQNWFNLFQQYYMQPFVDVGSGFVKFAGKLTFNYDPSQGSNFVIKTTGNSFVWRWILAYPIDGQAVGCVPPQQFNDVNVSYTQDWEDIAIYCGNGGGFYGHMFAGYRAVFNPIQIPTPQAVVVPFDIVADWAG
jgi:hypothetical protein